MNGAYEFDTKTDLVYLRQIKLRRTSPMLERPDCDGRRLDFLVQLRVCDAERPQPAKTLSRLLFLWI
jgi:hypothetical protein